jgi:hypothetical protein
MRTHIDNNEDGTTEITFIIGATCEKCKFVELTPDVKDLGMDKIDWNLVANKQNVFSSL